MCEESRHPRCDFNGNQQVDVEDLIKVLRLVQENPQELPGPSTGGCDGPSRPPLYIQSTK